MFGCGYWLDCGCLALLCVSLCPLAPYGNHAQLRGGNDAERVRSTLAYGWVERCSDIAGCRTSFFQDKYYCLCLTLQLYFLVNDHEHVNFLNKMNVGCFMSMNIM